MKYKDLTTLILYHILLLIGGTSFFVLLFQTQLFSNIEVFFYRGILLLITVCVVFAVGLIIFKRKTKYKIFTYRDIILSIVLIFSFNIIFFTHVPVTADRSISVFVLGYMNYNQDKSFTKQEITDVFSQKFIKEADGIDKRFKEQVATGNLVKIGNTYQITSQGIRLMMLYSIVGEAFNINKENYSKN